MSETQKPAVGRIVHYVIGIGHDGKPFVQPAMIVRAWDGGHGVNLQVFLDGGNCGPGHILEPMPGAAPSIDECARGLAWRTSVVHDDAKRVNTWHWPERG